MGATNINHILDLSVVKHSNLRLIVKKAVEFVEEHKRMGNEINGLNFWVVPKKSPGKISISMKINEKGGDKLIYSPPKTWDKQLTVACFLYSMAKYANLGNRATILCTNSRSRGDLQQSISTKHIKSKLQKKLNALLTDQGFIDELVPKTSELPKDLSPIQRDLILMSVNNVVGQSILFSIMKAHESNDIQIYKEWEAMKHIKALDESLVPIEIHFKSFSIHEVMELLKIEAPALREKADDLEELLYSSQMELKRLRGRSLWQRILNK